MLFDFSVQSICILPAVFLSISSLMKNEDNWTTHLSVTMLAIGTWQLSIGIGKAFIMEKYRWYLVSVVIYLLCLVLDDSLFLCGFGFAIWFYWQTIIELIRRFR